MDTAVRKICPEVHHHLPLADTKHIKSFDLGYTCIASCMISVSVDTYEHCQTQHTELFPLGQTAVVAQRTISLALGKPNTIWSNSLPKLCHSTIHIKLMLFNWANAMEKKKKKKGLHPGKSVPWVLNFTSKKRFWMP